MDTELAVTLWLEALEAEGKATSTIQHYRHFTRPLVAIVPTLPAGEEATHGLRRFLAGYRQNHAPESVRSVFVAWHSFGNWLVREGLCSQSPVAGVRAPRTPIVAKDAYPEGQLRALFTYLVNQHTPVGLRDFALCAILADCGLRASEACRLTVDDLASGALVIRQSKSGRPRVVPMGARSERAVGRYLSHGRAGLTPKGRWLLLNREGGPMDRHAVQKVMMRLSRHLGVHYNAHRFRRTWATMHLRAGTPMDAVRRMGGWSNYVILQRYSALTVDDLREAQRRASPLDRLSRRED